LSFTQDNKPFAVTNDFIVLTSALAHKITDVTNAEKNRSTASFFEQRSLATEFNKKLNTEFQLIVRIFARIEAADRVAVPEPEAADASNDDPAPAAADDGLMSSLFDIITCSPTKSYKIRPAASGIPAPSAPAAPGASEVAKVLELAAVEGGLETQSVAPSTMGEEVAAPPDESADKPEPTPAPARTTPPEPTPTVPLATAPKKKKSRRRSLSKFLKKAFVPADPVPAPAPSKKAVPKAPIAAPIAAPAKVEAPSDAPSIAAPIAAPAGVEAPSDAPSIEAKAKEAPSLTTKEAPSLATKEAPSIAAKDTDSTSSEKSVNDDPVADDPVADEAPKTPLAGGGSNIKTMASC
jgi:hypothetical protein